MKKVTFAICGVGNRGTAYASKQAVFPEEMEVVAFAERRPGFYENALKTLNVPAEHAFHSADELFAAGKLADVCIISTQDSQHKEHAIKAMETGYDLILEKPIATTLEDCEEIYAASLKYKKRVLVCHVLRYTPFYRTLKNMIKDGKIGDVVSIEATEGVGYYHQAHSYVRGNWHNSKTSSPMILAKSCHDMDLLVWLAGKNCARLNSFGSLSYFKKENMPEGAAKRCVDCPVKDCEYNAVNFYIERMPGWPTNVITSEPDNKEKIVEALRTGDYGRCVFDMDNDVVDHQTVNIEFDDGATATFQMVAFINKSDRRIRVMGTKGEISGDMRTNILHYHRFGGESVDVNVAEGIALHGHGGGDTGLIRDALWYFADAEFDRTSITELKNSLQSHRMAFAAEESRLSGGEVKVP